MMKKQDIKKLQRMIALTLSLVGGLYHMAWAEPAATALPTGNTGEVNAKVTTDSAKPVMTIEQTKGQNRAFISWDTFNIGKDATVNIKQHSGADLLVNAVRGNSMSEIAGKLNATGNVALINPNGVIFMNGAQVNVGGLGVYATGYDATNQKFLTSGGKEGRIEIQSGATINAGVSVALKNLSALNIDPKDYAIAIDSTGEDGYTNRIHLVADGNVKIQGGSTLTAKDYAYIGPNASVGDEGFNVGVGAIGMGGKIYIRSDRDADDYGQVIITHGEKTNAPVMQSVNGVSIYTNADQVDADSTKPGVNAAVSRTESGDGATVTYYTKHDYKNIPTFDIDGSTYTDGTSVSVDGPGITADQLSNESDAKNKISTSYGGNGKTTVTTSLLVNNMDQLQDIEDENTGNLDGRYVPGRDINATDDAHSYIDDGVLYTKNSDGSVKKWSTADGVEITGTKSGGNLSKTVNGTTIGYSKDENKATTKLAKDTELSDGTKLSEETTLSNNGKVTSAENTQWSTTKGVSTVTDKTAGSAYTIQSDKTSVVDKDGLTSDTTAKTVTDKNNTYTADISKNTVTHTSDSSVTDTNSHTVTKPAGTSDVGYTAEVTDGTDTAAGTSGTIAINGITYTVTNGTVGDTVTYQGSSVTTDKNTVTTGGVTTVVANDSTAAEAVKEGTIAGDRVTVNGTTTTVTDGTASYQITTGTDAVTYTKGTTTASISGTKVTTGEVSVDTSAGTVTKGDTTAAITGDTTGTVTYSGRDYTVSDRTVSTTDSTTGKTITVTGEDAANVLTVFSDAKTNLSNAKSIYSVYTTDAAKAQSLTKTLDAAIKTLNAVMNHSTADETVLSNFSSAAKQLQGDTALFNTARAALTNATTALTQYNALQKAISDNMALEAPLKQAYSEFQSTHLDDKKIENIHSDKWDDGKGFNPIGDTTNPFTGTIDGFSGERVFGISNLTINRPGEDNVGLVGAADKSDTHSADFVNLSLSNVSITGKDNVGAIAGTLQNGSHISWSSTSGTVTGKGESIGGFAGLIDNSSMWDISNSATVQGNSTDGTDKKIGGIAGTLSNSSTLTDVRNFAAISGTEDVGGIAGYVENGTILGTGSAIYNYANTYNTGKVTGMTDTGGIVGHAKGIYMYRVFNTNEDAPLSKTSQLIIDDDNKVIQRGDGKTDDKGKTITDTALQSNYGRVKGVTNTGGLVGYLEDAPGFKKTVTNINVNSTPKTETDGTTTKEAVKDAPITNNVIDTSYNAGNITGTGDNTGGLVGQMTGGTLSNVYNADNNTVLREQGSIPDAVKNAEIKDTSDNSKTYKYSDTKVSDCSNQDLTQYYSFFTVDDSGSRTYYYFIPVSTTSGTTQKGAGGIYVDKNGSPVASLPSTKERYYFNRTFNKDANVTGTGKNTGGLVGSMTTTAGTTAAKYSAGSVIDSAYNAGTITGSDTATTGALVGSKDDASLINDSFYVTGTDAANGNTYSNTVSKTVGASSSQDKNIENTDVLDVTRSKKKFYVSNDSTRKNFPGVQQKTLTEKDETDSKSTIYYEYTSGTNGSFYTDGTGSMDSINNIYPITTTGTTDSSTGKTTYTSTRSTTAAYTRQDDGTFQDAGGNTYTAAYDTATRQIILRPVSGSSSTAATVVLNAVLAARTANETWTIYEDQTRPLLTAFLNKASLSRTFSYDGTTHNLKTDDVANLYGRADFDGDAGKDVQLSNYQLSSNGVSSEYTYDNTSIWSPQHGYYMDPESTLVINPVNMSANLYGTRVYGDIFNTRGYYVCVPYTENGTKKYSFYKPVEESGKEGYTLLKDTDSDKALTEFFGKYDQTEDGLLKLAEEKGFYVLELNGFINGEGVDNLGKLITGLVSTLSNSSSTTTTSGSNLQHLFSSVTADTYLDAGIYNVTNAQITGLTATNQNYTINYGGTLTVKQAELYYTYDGSREYGAQNKDGEHTYTLVGVDSGKDETTDKYTSTHGFLKYWDLNNKTITIKNDYGTEATITNPYTDFFKKNGDTYEINQDNIGVTGYTAEKTTTTTDVTTGKSTTVTSKDDTKSASLDDIYTNMTGTINKDSINLPSTDTEKVIGSYGDGAVNDGMYTHVLVDKDGKPIGYKVTSFASSNKDADGTIQLYFKASSDTTNTADKNMQAAVDKFNKNYKLVWKEGGTYDKVYTIGDPEKPTPSGDAGIKTETDGLKVNDSTFTILPKTATVTITGNRQYGDTMDTSSYSTSTGTAASGQDKDAKKYNVNIDGLTNGDDASILNPTKTETLLSGIDKTTGTATDAKAKTEINKYTDVVRDANNQASYQDISDFTNSKVSVANGDASTKKMNVTDSILKSNNYDYILQDGTHQLKITPVSIKVTVNGSKTYGDFNSQAAKDYTTSIEMGGKTTDVGNKGKVTLKTGEVADIDIANKLNEQRDAGNYSFYSTTSPYETDGAFTISLSDDSAENANQKEYVADNYNLSFGTTYTIGKADLYYTYDGERSYGADNSSGTHTYTLVGIDSDSGKRTVQGYLKSWDTGVLQSIADRTLDNNRLQVENANYGMTGRGVQEADTDNAVEAKNVTSPTEVRSIGNDKNNGYSHVIVDGDGKILSYTVDGLDRQLAGTSGSTLAKNYNLIWKKAGNYTVAAQERTSSDAPIQQEKQDITVQNSSYRIDPLKLTVTVTGQRDYGDSMNEVLSYTTDGTAGKDQYNISVTGDFANGETADSVLNKDNVEKMLESLENDTDATRENSNGADGKISKYTDVKRNANDKSTIDSYNLKVGSTDTSSTITLASDVTKDGEKIVSIKHANDSDKEHGFNVLNKDNYDYVISDGTHTLAINPVDLTVDIKGESTYGKTDTKYAVTSIGAKNDETMTVDSGTLSNLVANSAAGSYTANEWTDTTGAATSKATAASGKYLNTAELRTGRKTAEGTDTDKGIYQVQLKAGENSTFRANNYNITYHTTQVINPEKLTITIDGTKVYGSQSAYLTSDAAKITGVVSGDAVPNVKITDNMNQTLMDAGTYHHDWSSYAGISDKKESYTYVDTDGKSQTVDKDKALGVTDVYVEENPGFSFNNYDIDFKSTYSVTPRTVRVTIDGASTYGDAARTAGTDYNVIDFERSGADGVKAQEGLVDGQTIDKSQVTVQTNGIDAKTDAGTYHLSQGAGTPGISGIKVTDGNGFQNKNYKIEIQGGTYTVNKHPLTLTIKGEKTYGDPTSFRGRDYTVSASGLRNNETIDFNDATVLHSAETGDRFSNAGEYHSSDGKGILGFEDSTLHGDGFKLGNYELTYDTVFTIDKRPVDVYMESRRMSGSPSSVRMDEPMTMRNVPEAHQGRFLADMQIIDTAPQVIAARDYPGFDGSGYLDLRFAGDIYGNYIIHRHTIYHILPDRMMKPGIYYAVQPERRPILDVMYFKVNGSEGINRWAGTEKPPYAGEIILNKDVTNSIQAAPDIMKKPGLPARPDQEFLKEEVTQAVPVVYTDGRKQDVRGRYHLAYEDNHVVIYPASDDVSVPRLKERPVSSEIRRVMRVPYQGGEGEYHVAYADGIVQVYPQNETAYRLIQAKGKDEQLLLQSSLTSAVQELGASLEDIGAVYVYTK